MSESVGWLDAGEVGDALGLEPIKALAWAHLYGLPTLSGRIERSAVSVLGRKLGLQVLMPDTDEEAEEANGIMDGLSETIRSDPEPRRRFVRGLLYRMERRGFWAPGGTRISSLRRGLPDRESNWVKGAVEALSRDGWVTVVPAKKGRSDPPCGLGRAHQDQIESFVQNGQAAGHDLAAWLKESG